MSGILRLANTGSGTGRSTVQSLASNDVVFSFPDTGTDGTATILTDDLYSISTLNWAGVSLNLGGDLNVDSGTLFVDESTNRVGIGTTSPAQLFHVAGIFKVDTDSVAPGTGQSIYQKASVGLGIAATNIHIETGAANARSTAIAINSSRDVGIGTETPVSKLHIAESANTVLSVQSTTAANNCALQLLKSDDTLGTGLTYLGATDDFRINHAGGNILCINTNQFVGIGTTNPRERLDVSNGIIRIPNAQTPANETDGAAYVGKIGSKAILSCQNVGLRTAATERLTVLNNGNVGIGNLSPAYELDVNGQIYANLVVADSSTDYGRTGAALILRGRLGNGTLIGTDFDGRAYIQGNYQDTVATARPFYLQPNGGDLFVGDVSNPLTINTSGRIVLPTSSAGISFEGNNVVAPAEGKTLNDYEIGTFTPQYGSTGTAPTGTYNNNGGGRYVKVGSLVFIAVRMRFDCSNRGSGSLQLIDLPFTIKNASMRGGLCVGSATNFDSVGPAPRSGVPVNSSTRCTFTTLGPANGSTQTCSVNSLQLNGGGGTSTNSNNIEIAFSYITDE